MKFSRRAFLACLSAVGLAAPVAYYGRREIKRQADADITPGEAVLEPATTGGEHLSHRLRGIWDFRFVDGGALAGLPRDGMEMLLDVGPTGRALRGYLGAGTTLRGDGEPEYRVSGSLSAVQGARVRWLLHAAGAGGGAARYECDAVIDEIWVEWGNAGAGTLSGELRELGRSLALPEQRRAFVASKRPLPEARERAALGAPFLAWLVSAEFRLFHQLWHASRDGWHNLAEARRDALRRLGWQPGPLNKERDARGRDKHRNGSGEDFLFMHRHMLRRAHELQPGLQHWSRLPLPAPFIEHDRQGFIRYFENRDGCSVPPAWEASGDAEYTRWLREVKSTGAFYSNYQVWETLYEDPAHLGRLTLGEFGSQIELGMHDWLHIRWATVTRDPNNGMPRFWDRKTTDFSPRWFLPENDYLGEPFSSHVNPVFWMFHGWIDDRIEDWFRAHERLHPGEVERRIVKGVPWFAPGRWVEVADPWLGASPYGCVPPTGQSDAAVDLDPEMMKLALRIALSGDDSAGNWLRRVPPRPWYARHLKLRDAGDPV